MPQTLQSNITQTEGRERRETHSEMLHPLESTTYTLNHSKVVTFML